MLEGCKPGKVVQLVDPRALREACLFRRPWLNMHHQNWFFKTFFGFDFTRKVLKQRYRPALEVDGWVQEDGSRVLLLLTRHRCTIYSDNSRMAHGASKPNRLCRQSVTLRKTDPQPRGKPGDFPQKKFQNMLSCWVQQQITIIILSPRQYHLIVSLPKEMQNPSVN